MLSLKHSKLLSDALATLFQNVGIVGFAINSDFNSLRKLPKETFESSFMSGSIENLIDLKYYPIGLTE